MGDSQRLLTASKHAAKLSDAPSSLLPTVAPTPAGEGIRTDGANAAPLSAQLRSPRRLAMKAGRAVASLGWTHRLVLLTLAFLALKILPLPFTAPISLHHPIPRLIAAAEAEHARRAASEPQTLEQAYARYVSRHGRRPPKGYDAWYNFAVQRGACRIDGFDEMHDSLRVWWGVEGREIRERMERIGAAGDGASALGRVRVRDGRLVRWAEMLEAGVAVGASNMDDQYARRAFAEMLDGLIDEGVRLPDVDFFISQLDEPRVVVPYELRTELEARGKKRRPRSPQLDEFVLHDINAPNSRPAYDVIRQTCPPASLARRARLAAEPGTNPHVSQRHTTPFATPAKLGMFLARPDLEHKTWCDQPDLQELHQAFVHPLSFSWTDRLFPVFSNSKLEGFNDILIPTWYQWFDKMPYEEERDVEWKGKANQMYWRGTNTGGRSLGLNWMGWTRSRLVSKVNRLIEWRHEDKVILASSDNKTLTAVLPSSALNSALTDVAFAAPDHHGDSASLESQLTEPSFRFTENGYVPFSNNYLFKAILDMDGTAYSGRFPTIMKSRSAVIKSRLFTQALDDTLIPWYHYVPLSVRFSELYNLLAYFFGLANVPRLAAEQGFPPLPPASLDAVRHGVAHEEALYAIAVRGRDWAFKCARKDDALVYVYLLALEWARLCADDREGDEWSMLL
ncbi:hypothetical protein JCM10450v2_006087 [Rhodotorula kratochvilovae]